MHHHPHGAVMRTFTITWQSPRGHQHHRDLTAEQVAFTGMYLRKKGVSYTIHLEGRTHELTPAPR